MTPDKRLNQIEPIIAEVAQKVDRLVDTTGTILHETSKIQGIEEKVGDIDTKVSELDTKVSGIETQVAKIPGIEAQVAKIPGIEAQVASIQIQVNKIPGIEKNVSTVAAGLAALTVEMHEFRAETRQQFGFLTDKIVGIEQTQVDILTLLRDKL